MRAAARRLPFFLLPFLSLIPSTFAAPASNSAEIRNPKSKIQNLEASGVRGGLIVFVGADELDTAVAAVRTGPFLAQVFDSSPVVVEQARHTI